MKLWASVQYPLSKGSGHVAGESIWCRSADIGTPNCVAHVGEVTPAIGEEGVCLYRYRSFVHHHGFWILLKVVMSLLGLTLDLEKMVYFST